MGPQNIHPHPPFLENAFWPEMGGGGGAYISSPWILLLGTIRLLLGRLSGILEDFRVFGNFFFVPGPGGGGLGLCGSGVLKGFRKR